MIISNFEIIFIILRMKKSYIHHLVKSYICIYIKIQKKYEHIRLRRKLTNNSSFLFDPQLSRYHFALSFIIDLLSENFF